ncbi:MAG: acyl-CoA dehydrogenase family protein [Acidobacteriota bacterium]|nr:acyl-CoA dehydrogenase family protein [Acidobacteriota bacterium]
MSHLKNFRGVEGTNFFEQDRGLRMLLDELLPRAVAEEVYSSLARCGSLVGGRWHELACAGNRAEHLPRIIKYDRAGNPIERVDMGLPVAQLRREVAEFGLLTAPRSHLHKFALVYLLAHNGEASLACPISCTDGLIQVLEAKGAEDLRATYLPRLRSIETPFAGAQFVTEQAGGSDVGAIAAVARPNADGSWSLTGDKWFCSNPDEFFAVAARVVDEGTNAAARSAPGTEGIGVFFVPRVLPDGRLNKLSLLRLKDKLGTRSLPTAEIKFENATAYPIGEPHEGFKTLMYYVLNVSRVHNAVNSCGFLHRAFLEARNYARQREAFGHTIINYPLVQETLLRLLARLWRQRLLTFRLISLLDQHGLAPADEAQAMWQRFLINLAKYRTAATLTSSIREALLILGGNGIVEDFTVLPRLLRDAMIIETWEGTHNTLCLQIVRDASGSRLLERWQAETSRAREGWPHDFLAATRRRFTAAHETLRTMISSNQFADRRWAARHARRFVDQLGNLLELAWLAELAVRHAHGAEPDMTAALLTVVAADELLPAEQMFASFSEKLDGYAAALIDETPVTADVSQL